MVIEKITGSELSVSTEENSVGWKLRKVETDYSNYCGKKGESFNFREF